MRNAAGVEETGAWDRNDEDDCEAWDLLYELAQCVVRWQHGTNSLAKACQSWYQSRRCLSLLVYTIKDQGEAFLIFQQSLEIDV